MFEDRDLPQDFELFREEAIRLRQCYNTYEVILREFEAYDDTTRALVLNRAGWFLNDIMPILRDHFFLIAGRLTDPATTLGRENLSVPGLNARLSAEGVFTPDIRDSAIVLETFRNTINSARNRRIAHLDLAAACSPQPLGAHSEEELDAFLENLQLYCDLAGIACGVGPLDFRSTPAKGDARDLMRVLSGREHGQLARNA